MFFRLNITGFFRSDYPSDVIPSSFNYELQQILGLKRQLCLSVKNQPFALFGFFILIGKNGIHYPVHFSASVSVDA